MLSAVIQAMPQLQREKKPHSLEMAVQKSLSLKMENALCCIPSLKIHIESKDCRMRFRTNAHLNV